MCPDLSMNPWDHALQDLNVELLKGQSLLVVGQSGCGKSSILRAIAGAQLLMHPPCACLCLLSVTLQTPPSFSWLCWDIGLP